MMRSVAVAVPPNAPSGLTATRVGNGNNRRVDLSWMDNSQNDTAFSVQRATSATGPWTPLVMLPSASGTTTGTRTWSDPIGNTNQTFYYQVSALNVVGDTWDYSDPNLNEIPPGGGFPTKTVSAQSNVATFAAAPAVPAAPSSVVATAFRVNNRNARVTVTWTDSANNETGFRIQRATNAAFTAGLVTSTVGANVTTFTTGNVPRFTDFYFRVQAYNATGSSAYVNASPFPVPTP